MARTAKKPELKFDSTAEAVSHIQELDLQRVTANSAKNRADEIAAAFRKWHEEHPDDEFYDGEHQLAIQFNTPSSRWTNVNEWGDDLLAFAAEHGLLSVKIGAIDTLHQSAPSTMTERLKSLLHEGAGTTQVSVVKVEE